MIFTFNSRVASSSCGDKHHVGILWEDKHGPHMVHSLLDGLVQSKRLVNPVMRIITWGSENKPVMEEKEQQNWKSTPEF